MPTLTDDHKSAMANGRQQSTAIREYLEALENNKPKRGRKRTEESIDRRMAVIDTELTGSINVMRRVALLQERKDLDLERLTMGHEPDLTNLEAAFVEHAKAYSERKGISYNTWREVGVPASVLKDAGITRGY